jgi:excinuclease UvrABC ATPase subunit
VGTLAVPIWQAYNMVDSSSTASGTVQNTEYTLNSVTLPAAFLKAARGIEIRAWGITTANGNAKNIKLYLGGTSIITVTGTTASGKHYLAKGYVLRTGASTQSSSGECQVDTSVAPQLLNSITTAETDTAAIIIALKSANTAAAAGSATGYGMIVRPIF